MNGANVSWFAVHYKIVWKDMNNVTLTQLPSWLTLSYMTSVSVQTYALNFKKPKYVFDRSEPVSRT